ncbi:nitrate reductase molybdenum cofactor assembly chaperone [Cellulosimicrobium sp. NPDC057127]|uniref:nitrate reductase molybdenum cofactor assembly chaperone n=1 Tax=Cellulosimicrobium sp. NPDC057127 TaxID=3346026 RepID=UPI00363551A8
MTSLLPLPRLRPGARRRAHDTGAATTPVPTTAAQRRTTHMAASLLLAYPDDDVLEAAAVVRPALAGLPAPVAAHLGTFCDVLEAAGPGDGLRELQARYVATFDLKRRCAMYLSYYATGDTRKRGIALVRFVEAYRAAGWELAARTAAGGPELPDHLPTVLEFSARTTGDDAAIAAGLLGAHRDGIEVLRAALTDLGSPWAGVVEAVCLTIPPLDDATARRYEALVTAGPPSEMVGLEGMEGLAPFGPTGTDERGARR